jgi:uncharacterized cupin superfamily protein
LTYRHIQQEANARNTRVEEVKMPANAATIQKKSLNQPEQTQRIGRLKVETVSIGSIEFQRFTAEPGWQWSKDIKPVVKTETCQVDHLLYFISGRIHVKMAHGNEVDFNAGDTGRIPPGHDGWVVGDAPAVWLEMSH